MAESYLLLGSGPMGDPPGFLTLTDCVLREPSPPNNSPGGGDDPASGRLGKGLGQGGREAGSSSGGFRRNARLYFFSLWGPLEASVAQSDSQAKWKDDFYGRVFFSHAPVL